MRNIIKEKTSLILKIIFMLLCICWVIPSIIYMVKNGTVLGFDTYYNFFIDVNANKIISTILYLLIFIGLIVIYVTFIKNKNLFKNIKYLLIYVGIISAIFVAMLPWTSSDIFYYMGVGELDSVYNQNPYYVTMKQYYEENQENIDDDIFEQGANNYWGNTTVIYGPIAQLIFSVIAKISFKNINFCLFLFKLLNAIIHILNCYLIYKLTKKLKFSVIYGLNPFVFLEFIGQVHNDIIIVFFILISLYFLLKKKNIYLSILFLAIATGMKYFAILLLPVIVLYHLRKEEKLSKRFLMCIVYGLMFLAIFALEYVIYFKDIEIFKAMFPQLGRYCKSIYSALIATNVRLKSNAGALRNGIFGIFVFIYIFFCINLLATKKIKFIDFMRKYNIILILFLLCLSNFQQWYLVWLFATMMWQKPNMIRNIVAVSLISEISNSIYMFKTENWIYDNIFVGSIIVLMIIFQIKTRKIDKAKSFS